MPTPTERGFVSIAYELTGDALAIEVVDDGKGFDPDQPPPLEGEELTEGGLGIAIIRTIADEFEIQSQPGVPRLASALREAPAPAAPDRCQHRQRPGGSSSSSPTARPVVVRRVTPTGDRVVRSGAAAGSSRRSAACSRITT